MIKRIFKILLGVILCVAAVLAVVLITLTITEYNPAEEEEISAEGSGSKELKVGDEISVISWNIGYGALGASADFFLDGGSKVRAQSKDEVEENIAAISDFLVSSDADVICLQEVDKDSVRSYGYDEANMIGESLSGYNSSFAYNYKVLFIPYPVPPIGRVNAGLSTYTAYDVDDVTRYQLPCPFSWPYRLVNLKRCLLISHIPIEGSDKELAIVNLHLEAYDSGEGKTEQTRILAEIMGAEYDVGNYVIAMGDFNQTFDDVDEDEYEDGIWTPETVEKDMFGEEWSLLYDEDTPTCRLLNKPYTGEDAVFYQLDGFIVSDNLTVKEMQAVDLDFQNSDHNPISLKVILN